MTTPYAPFRPLGRVLFLSVFAALISLALPAAEEDLTAIQDNSFLVEEAYNQETGVIQHISFFMRDQRSHQWVYTFTQEWPAPTQKHQLSYTVPLLGGSARGVGDVMLNYRYQLVGDGEARLAIAPRVSMILPTGDEARGRGRGHSGVQIALPVSRVLASRVVSHSDVGVTAYRSGAGVDVAAAQSIIYALTSRMHVMVEATWSRTDINGSSRSELLISPGLRWAHNLSSGLQIVPGIALAVGAGPSAGDRSFIGYLSFEHPFSRP